MVCILFTTTIQADRVQAYIRWCSKSTLAEIKNTFEWQDTEDNLFNISQNVWKWGEKTDWMTMIIVYATIE